MAENVRMLVWDLDETFWQGTLSEGGITAYVQAHHDIGIELARRGIMSSICSKNDLGPVKAILQDRGIWDYFIFPSIDWGPKGGRVETVIETVQLRAASVMFIDDNPGNRAEVAARVPGVQVEDENFIAGLLDDPRFMGKDDRELSRLAQYKLLEQRQADEAKAGGDNTEFLRGCDIRVVIETDIEPHIARAIELINRTNQLNFTKRRLPEDMEAARAALRELLSRFWTTAALVRVIDNYGDYGYCGFYVLEGGTSQLRPYATHFCFSCRILGMGIEQFVYQRASKPRLRVKGEVISDLTKPAQVDWIRLLVDAPKAEATTAKPTKLPEVRLYGGCEMQPLSHYFGLVADRVTSEDNFFRKELFVRHDNSDMLRIAMTGGFDRVPFPALGYRPEDFSSVFLDPAPPGTWLVLSVWGDQRLVFFDHKATGIRLACDMPKSAGGPCANLMSLNDADIALRIGPEGWKPEHSAEIFRAIRTLREEFAFHGRLTLDEIEANLRLIWMAVPKGARLIMLLQSEFDSAGRPRAMVPDINRRLRQIGAEFPAVHFVAIDELVPRDKERQRGADHFDRQAYFRVYRRMMEIIVNGRKIGKRINSGD